MKVLIEDNGKLFEVVDRKCAGCESKMCTRFCRKKKAWKKVYEATRKGSFDLEPFQLEIGNESSEVKGFCLEQRWRKVLKGASND